MAVLPILKYPDPRLNVAASPVADFGASFQCLVDDMIETMYQNRGAGLAAVQVGVSSSVFVMDCAADGEPSRLFVFCNPVLGFHEFSMQLDDEGCLSFPGVVIRKPRHTTVNVQAQDRYGVSFTATYHGFEARCVEHETEHLLGKTMLDGASRIQRKFVESELRKRRK